MTRVPIVLTGILFSIWIITAHGKFKPWSIIVIIPSGFPTFFNFLNIESTVYYYNNYTFDYLISRHINAFKISKSVESNKNKWRKIPHSNSWIRNIFQLSKEILYPFWNRPSILSTGNYILEPSAPWITRAVELPGFYIWALPWITSWIIFLAWITFEKFESGLIISSTCNWLLMLKTRFIL